MQILVSSAWADAADDPPIRGGLIALVELFDALWPKQAAAPETDPAEDA